MSGIYVASKTKHARLWRKLQARGVPITCSWIDDAGVGETSDWQDLWERCIREASHADRLVVYLEPGEVLKGALVEVGVALACGVPVEVVGDPTGQGSWWRSRGVSIVSQKDISAYFSQETGSGLKKTNKTEVTDGEKNG